MEDQDKKDRAEFLKWVAENFRWNHTHRHWNDKAGGILTHDMLVDAYELLRSKNQ